MAVVSKGLENSPWLSYEELEQDLKLAWEDMKKQGLEQSVLTEREDGAIVGHGDPDKWFDLVRNRG